MSTPPSPIAAPVQPSAQPTQPGLSEGARIVDTFVAPSKTFLDLRRNASWWVPFLLGAIFGLAFIAVLIQKVDLDQFVREQIAKSSRAAQFDSLPKEQQEQQLAFAAKFTKIVMYATPVLGGIVGGLLLTTVLWMTFNFGFAADMPFGRALAISFYAWFPAHAVYAVLGIVSLLIGINPEGINIKNPVATNPAYFMDVNATSTFVYGMVASVDIIAIWTIVLLGLGFSLNSANRKLSAGTAIGVVAAFYVLARLILAPLGS
jgi:hypothetical protein